jgi:putative ABC transport system ATP-binding protein
VALLGPSGSGKSTLLNLVSGIDTPDAGSIDIDGVRVTDLDERERTLFRRRHIGFVFQFFNLLPTLTVEENLLLPLELKGRLDAAARRRARELLEHVGLADRAATFPDRLSGGEQQRIALARALVHEPALILADEPTGNLDPATGEKMLDLLDRLVRDAGRTLLVVTHSRELAAHADRVLRIVDGRLEEGAV